MFLERQFAELAAKASEEKMVAALQKCWGKMTSVAQAEALKLNFTGVGRRMLNLAIFSGNPPPI